MDKIIREVEKRELVINQINGDLLLITTFKDSKKLVKNISAVRRRNTELLLKKITKLKEENNFMRGEISNIMKILEHHNLKINEVYD